MIQVVLAQPRGFCAGVERAIEIVERALAKFGPPIYVRHEIVHNRHVVDDLRRRGAIFVDELSEIPPGAVTVFSAHGVAKHVEDLARERGLPVIDATCPWSPRSMWRAGAMPRRGGRSFSSAMPVMPRSTAPSARFRPAFTSSRPSPMSPPLSGRPAPPGLCDPDHALGRRHPLGRRRPGRPLSRHRGSRRSRYLLCNSEPPTIRARPCKARRSHPCGRLEEFFQLQPAARDRYRTRQAKLPRRRRRRFGGGLVRWGRPHRPDRRSQCAGEPGSRALSRPSAVSERSPCLRCPASPKTSNSSFRPNSRKLGRGIKPHVRSAQASRQGRSIRRPEASRRRQALPARAHARAVVPLQPGLLRVWQDRLPGRDPESAHLRRRRARRVDECGAPVVAIAGGEPLLHKEMPEIVQGMLDRKKFVYLCTNALLLEKKMDLFQAQPVLQLGHPSRRRP